MRLVYISPVPWSSFAQRPHQFVEWFHAKSNDQVLWIDPYPTRLPQLADFQRSVKKGSTNFNTPTWLTVLRPPSIPIEPLPGSGIIHSFLWRGLFKQIDDFVRQGQCQLAIGKPCELGLQVLARYPSISSTYDAMDDFPAFYSGLSRWAMGRREQKIAADANNILVSSNALAERFSAYQSKLSIALNACGIDTLPKINAPNLKEKNLILGYVGTIGHWFDWPLVFNLANANPTMCVRLIGPVYHPPPRSIPKNIELLPACDHRTAIEHMQQFSIGLIPFKQIDLTASVDPIKYYEYRALGIPVLSSDFGQMSLRNENDGVVRIARDSDLALATTKALSLKSDADEIEKFRANHSWQARFDATNIFYK